MLTIFAVPKAFEGHHGLIQRNAIKSWKALEPTPEILIIGDDPGTAETAEELGVTHLPGVETDDYDTPLISSIFEMAQEHASNETMLYTNADIIYLQELVDAVRSVASQEDAFLMGGRRWMVDIEEALDFTDPETPRRLERLAEASEMDHWSSIDYLCFPRGQFKDLPPLSVGRPIWDDYMLYNARDRGIPLINATADVRAIHQNHDYSHAGGRDKVFGGELGQRNLELVPKDCRFCLADATHVLEDGKVEEASGYPYNWRHFYNLPVFYPALKPMRWVLDASLAVTRPVRKIIGLRI